MLYVIKQANEQRTPGPVKAGQVTSAGSVAENQAVSDTAGAGGPPWR